MTEETNKFIPDSVTEDIGPKPRKFPSLKILTWLFLIVVIFSFSAVHYVSRLNEPAENFPTGTPVTIPVGTEVRSITKILADNNYVKSDSLLYFILIANYEPTQIKASTYIFDRPLTTKEIGERLIKGDFNSNLTRFTHIEGERATVLAKRASEKLPDFDGDVFIQASEPLEGKLFPETYFIPEDFDELQLLNLLTETYTKEIEKLQPQIEAHALTEDEIIVLASIIEREANSTTSKKMVSGILQNRLAIDMPLQADASIEYILDKPLAELTPEDLEIDSPYNTYLNRGLPPTPIGNPGLEAIMAVLEPTPSEYLFYITDETGEFHYAKTYDEHLKNVARYLR